MIHEAAARSIEPFICLSHIGKRLTAAPVAKTVVQSCEQDQPLFELDVLPDAVLRRRHGLFCLDDRLQLPDQRREIILNDGPEDIEVDRVVTMNQPIA
jgi:hypothetical protein